MIETHIKSKQSKTKMQEIWQKFSGYFGDGSNNEIGMGFGVGILVGA